MDTHIQNIIDALTTPRITIENTVDVLEFGNPASIVTGVVTTFLATQEVIEKAKDLGANLIISHEGIFYSHRGNQGMSHSDSIYQKKYQTIEESEIAIFRYHDYIHRYIPDGITSGLLSALKWENYEVKNQQVASILEIPSMTLQDIVTHVKKSLDIQYVRYAGDLSSLCRRIGILVGYRGGGELTIPLFEKENLDMVIYGEGPEWETPEYVSDAIQQGKQKGLIVLGHAESEAPGMEYLAQWLQKRFPGVPVHFIPHSPVFQIL